MRRGAYYKEKVKNEDLTGNIKFGCRMVDTEGALSKYKEGENITTFDINKIEFEFDILIMPYGTDGAR